MAESPNFYEGSELLDQVFPNSLYSDANFELYIQQLKAQQRSRIENLRELIDRYSEFDGHEENMENFAVLQDYEEEIDEQMNNIRTVLNSKERRLKDALNNLERFVNVQSGFLRLIRYNRQLDYTMQFDDVKKKINLVNRQYQLLEKQLKRLAKMSLQAIDVLQQCKTSARTFLFVFLQAQHRTSRFYIQFDEDNESPIIVDDDDDDDDDYE